MGPLLPDLDTLSLAEQVAQMVVVRAAGYLFDHQIQYPQWEPPAERLRYWLEDLGVGGVILLGGSAAELALRTRQLQSWAKIPLLIAADIEEGVGQRFAGATWLPPPMAIAALGRRVPDIAQQYATQMGAITAQEALAIGLNWVLAPVVDVNNNPNNPVINIRAFGETPQEVSQLATAFIRGAKAHQVLTTAKHFPGHGDTTTDSHLDLPVVLHSSTRLAEVELPPFQAAIAAGVDGVMSAHLLIQCWDSECPATLSKQILTGQLRQKLGFEGLIVTDALVMGAIVNRYGADVAPVLAVEAGADVLLMPVDPESAIQAVCQAVATGRIEAAQIRASVERIWQAKLKVCVPPTSMEPSAITACLASPSATSTTTELLQATQLVQGVPLGADFKLSCPSHNLIAVDDLLTCDFLSLSAPAIAVPAKRGYITQVTDYYRPSVIGETYPTLLQIFIRGNPFRGSAGINLVIQELLKKLILSGDLQAIIIYGSPYVLEQLLPSLPAQTPCIFSYGQMPLAQELALNALFS